MRVHRRSAHASRAAVNQKVVPLTTLCARQSCGSMRRKRDVLASVHQQLQTAQAAVQLLGQQLLGICSCTKNASVFIASSTHLLLEQRLQQEASIRVLQLLAATFATIAVGNTVGRASAAGIRVQARGDKQGGQLQQRRRIGVCRLRRRLQHYQIRARPAQLAGLRFERTDRSFTDQRCDVSSARLVQE